MKGSNRFQILFGECVNVGTYTATGNLGYGTGMDAAAGEARIAPTNGQLLGFITKDVTLTGPSLEKQMLGYQDLPATSGDYVGVQQVQAGGIIEVESEPSIAYNTDPSDPTAPYLLVTTGTGAISSSTAAGTELNLQNGRWRVAQTSDVVTGRMIKADCTPVIADTNIRVRIQIVSAHVK